MGDFLWYFLQTVILSLGIAVLCGFAVRLCAKAFSALIGKGSSSVFDITSLIGTPVHELGHAVMCPLFGHKIVKIKLWSLFSKSGVYGFVEHTYNRRNLWARLGNLFIGIGPIFSGLGITVLCLWLCFPAQWEEYLAVSQVLLARGGSVADISSGVLSLLFSLPSAFSGGWLRPLLGLLIILPVSLHISLSKADVKGSLEALPLYLLLALVFSAVTFFLDLNQPILAAMQLWNLRLLSLFCVVIAFSAVWVALGLLVWLVRKLFHCF